MFIFLILLSTVIYLSLYYVFSYWKRRGFPYIKPEIPYGNLKSVIFGKTTFGMRCYEIYKSVSEPFIGIYSLYKPVVLIRDPILVKRILNDDFNSFHDRGIYCNEKYDPLTTNLFCLEGEKWKELRQKLTPAFTSGKLKAMCPTILDVGLKLEKSLQPIADNNEVINVKQIFTNYALDIVASVIFGLEVNTIKEPDHIFSQTINLINHPNLLQAIQISLAFFCPKLLTLLRLPMFSKKIYNNMLHLTNSVISLRENNNYKRNDIMELLIELHKTGSVEEDSSIKNCDKSKNKIPLTLNEVAAQSLVFYGGGSETTSSLMSFCLYEIVKNSDVLIKVQNEIDIVLSKYNYEVTYDALNDMIYMEQCIKETLRLYPGLPVLNRECKTTYQIPDTNHIIEKGTTIFIPLLGIHRDPNIFSEPLKFNPERFSSENKNYSENYFYAFGSGPRACIAFRMGKLVAKIGLVLMLRKFNFAIENKNIDEEFEYEVGTVTLIPKNGFPIRVSNR